MVEMKERMTMSGRMAATFVRECSLALWVVALVAIGAAPAAAQGFNSGSSGVHGAFPPTPVALNASGPTYILLNMDTGLVRYCSSYDFNLAPDTCTTQLGTAQIPGIPVGGLTTGIFEFTSFVLPDRASATLQVAVIPVGNSRNNPLTILSQGDIRLGAVTYIYAVGWPGLNPGGVGAPGAGGRGGPGGFAGGTGGIGGTTATGGAPGFGPAGGAGGILVAGSLGGQSAGTSPASVILTPVVGGSGGGGTTGIPGSGTPCAIGPAGSAGAGGGGGGGAVLLAASGEIALTSGGGVSSIYTTGGAAGQLINTTCGNLPGGLGEPGSVRVVASKISGAGTISTGRLRIEASTSTFTGGVPAGTSFTQFPARPIPTALPTLRVTSVNGVAAPANPSGSLAAPDLNFPSAITGSVTVNIGASNVPTGTQVFVRVVPTNSAFTATTATSTALAGTLDNSTATASIGIPPGVGSMTISATFQITPLFSQLKLPTVDGAVPALAEVVVGKDGASHFYLLGKEGSRVEMTPEMWKAATSTN
jgi:hypothetical protein